MRRKILSLIPVVAFLIASTGYSYSNPNEVKSHSKKQTDQCSSCETCDPCKPCCNELPSTGEPCNCAYNAPARIDPACGWNSWGTASFIYWQVKERGLDLGVHYKGTDSSHGDYDIIAIDFDYHPGFKIGAGFSDNKDDWSLYLEYTRLKSKDSASKDLGSEFVFYENTITSSWSGYYATKHISYIKGVFEINYNIFDIELSRSYYLGKKLIFSPNIGLKAGWIDQRMDLDFTFYDTEKNLASENGQDSWLLGPKIGMDTNWLIGCGFKFFGNVAGALTYQNFKNLAIFKVPPQEYQPPGGYYVNKSESSYVLPNLEMSFGLNYGTYFYNNQCHFDLAASYDFNYFLHQNRMIVLNEDSYFSNGNEGNDLMLHGLTITARLDF